MADNLCYIKPKNTLKKRDKKQKIINAIKEKVMSLHNFQALRNNQSVDPELILMICNCVENTIKKHAGINKKEFVVEIVKEIFGDLFPLEISNIEAQCQFNYDNGLIQKISTVCKGSSLLYNYIKSKL